MSEHCTRFVLRSQSVLLAALVKISAPSWRAERIGAWRVEAGEGLQRQ
jgi:hypothetical protein